jgi:hypothetical protein
VNGRSATRSNALMLFGLSMFAFWLVPAPWVMPASAQSVSLAVTGQALPQPNRQILRPQTVQAPFPLPTAQQAVPEQFRPAPIQWPGRPSNGITLPSALQAFPQPSTGPTQGQPVVAMTADDPLGCGALLMAAQPACVRAEIAYYHNLEYTAQQTEKVFDEQLRETRIITWLLILMFLLSATLAVVQFVFALRAGNQNIKNSIETGSTVKVSKDGLEVSSSILGVILLAFSMLFFYLYLQMVYRIT